MKTLNRSTVTCVALLGVAGILVLWLVWPGAAQDQADKTKDPAAAVHPDKGADAKELAAQVAELRTKVARLEAALQKMPPAGSSMGKGMMGMEDMMMGGMGKKPGMAGMMGMEDMMMGGMGKGGAKPGMGMMDDDDKEMMSMMGMGSMGGKGMTKMQMTAALPGFPGASHIYHIGATGFFLDHPEHLTLTTKQQTSLNQIKQKSLLDKAKAQRQIDEAEQELWELTGADEPDAAKIQTKVQAIEKLRGEQRLAFIRAIGEAAKVLTDEQRQVLLGQAKPDAHKAHPPASK